MDLNFLFARSHRRQKVGRERGTLACSPHGHSLLSVIMTSGDYSAAFGSSFFFTFFLAGGLSDAITTFGFELFSSRTTRSP